MGRVNRKIPRCGFLATVIVAFLMSSASPAAAEKALVLPEAEWSSFRLNAGAYLFLVSGSAGTVSVTAERGKASAVYSAEGTTSADSLDAKLGSRGRIDVQFEPMRVREISPWRQGGCRAARKIITSGVFTGTIEFKGEHEYATLRRSRARGSVVRISRQRCSGRPRAAGAAPVQWTILSATSRSQHVIFDVYQQMSANHPQLDGTVFTAAISEIRPGPLLILRSISASSTQLPFRDAQSGARLESAVLQPPSPFTGVGKFRVDGNSGYWRGSLAGDFLGRGTVPLAGPEFTAEISSQDGFVTHSPSD
jgi:hypothetical protein